ncbi:hypothetical protein ACXR0O_12030 [Verrucomicrobiota bacterium sgz303538]
MRVSRKTKAALFAVALCAFPHTRACGPWLPNRFLARGGESILKPPEFFFELEMKRLAKSYPSAFRSVDPFASAEQPAQEPVDADPRLPSSYVRQTANADRADFAAAIAAGHIEPPDRDKAKAEHEDSRQFIQSATPDDARLPPQEFPSEFADYHRGAMAFRRGKLDEAREAWTALLSRPPAERRYRSTWAEFMLGKMALAQNRPEAREHFERVRKLASEGFGDSLGLAAASLGWQARFELGQGALESAGPLYLQQLASGDLSGVSSLLTVARTALPAQPEQPDLPRLAKDKTLRQIVSAFILTRAIPMGEKGPESLPARWLATMEAAGLKEIEDADRLGWAAYSMGRYDEAKRWLERAQPDSGLALWLRAKLEFRAGHLAEAAGALAQAVPKLPRGEKLELRELNPDELIPSDLAYADLGLLRLARTEFTGALKTLLAANHWQDAAYIAERVLTIEELRTFLKAEYAAVPESPKPEPGKEGADEEKVHYDFDHTPETVEDTTRQLRWLLARRLVRGGRFVEAQPLFPVEWRPVIDRYATALKLGNATSKPKAARANALWEAAQVARKNGMELMGTEMEPDAFIWDGQFEEEPVAQERLNGTYLSNGADDEVSQNEGDEAPKVRPLVIPSSPDERRRLAKHGITPDTRFHYRYLAADLAWRAAKLMPDNNEETARVLNTAGLWLMARDEDAADRFYQAIEKRCSETKLGKEAIARHWFVPPPPEEPSPQQ